MKVANDYAITIEVTQEDWVLPGHNKKHQSTNDANDSSGLFYQGYT